MLVTSLARDLYDSVAADRDPDPGLHVSLAESGAHLYRTTSYFLERIGVTSLDELPELAPFLPELDEVEQEQIVKQKR